MFGKKTSKLDEGIEELTFHVLELPALLDNAQGLHCAVLASLKKLSQEMNDSLLEARRYRKSGFGVRSDGLSAVDNGLKCARELRTGLDLAAILAPTGAQLEIDLARRKALEANAGIDG